MQTFPVKQFLLFEIRSVFSVVLLKVSEAPHDVTLRRVVNACDVFIFKREVDTCLIPDTDRLMENSVLINEPVTTSM